jgi:hypothetical protein
MDYRAMIERHLAEAERHVQLGERIIAQQHKLVEELERDQHDTATAKALLAKFEELLAQHVSHRDRLKRDLAAISQQLA